MNHAVSSEFSAKIGVIVYSGLCVGDTDPPGGASIPFANFFKNEKKRIKSRKHLFLMFSFQGAFWSLIVDIFVAAIRIILIFIYRAPEGKQIIEHLFQCNPFPRNLFKFHQQGDVRF